MPASHPVIEFLEFVEGQPNKSSTALLKNILQKCRMLTHAEAGTIFLLRRNREKTWLEPSCIQNDAIPVSRHDFLVPIKSHTVAGYVAQTGDTVVIDDVYAISPDKPFSFDAAWDKKRYRTKSMFCFALKNYRDKTIGVVQLINARPPNSVEPVSFEADVIDLVLPVSRAIGHAIERAEMLEKIKITNADLRRANRMLQTEREKVLDLQAQTEDAFQLSISLLAKAAEIHDEETGNHIIRVNEYCYFVAKTRGLPAQFCDDIHYSAQLHDVGKMSVDSAVLKKRGPLNPAEREEMDKHTIYGYQILSAAPRLQLGAEIALYHHERWDGTGYPRGISGADIPISARIVQLADIYDALRSTRPYKNAFTHAETVDIITKGDARVSPNHFDPDLLALFKNNHDAFDGIWQEWSD